jgi:hypothetical protein
VILCTSVTKILLEADRPVGPRLGDPAIFRTALLSHPAALALRTRSKERISRVVLRVSFARSMQAKMHARKGKGIVIAMRIVMPKQVAQSQSARGRVHMR